MGYRRVQGTTWNCDGCEVEEFVADASVIAGQVPADPKPPKEWIRGTVDAGVVGGEWIAHHQKCIQRAVNSILSPEPKGSASAS